MKSGQASGSRFGFKGTEDLGNGMTVGFTSKMASCLTPVSMTR